MINSLKSKCKLLISLMLFSHIIAGCTTVTIDQAKMSNVKQSQLEQGKSVVIVGRRSGSDYETEPDLINCIGKVLGSGQNQVQVISEQTFTDSLYPWFEPRTAPVRANDLFKLLEYQQLNQAISDFNLQYLIWVDGSTQTTNKSGQITCSLGVTGVSCFGFGSWDKKADYEATIWSYTEQKMVGKISGSADGTSYMPAIIVPIPIIAPVQSDVCKAIGLQLRSFFQVDPVAATDSNDQT